MSKKKSKIKFSTALISVVTIAVLAATSVFVSASAAPAGSDPDNLGEPKIIMTTSKAVGETLDFKLNVADAYVDWGDGNIVQGTGEDYSQALKGQTVKVYSTADITYFDCHENQLTEIDVSKNPALFYLGCYDNDLTEIDVSKNPALDYLYCDRNNLTELDVTNNPVLTWLLCDDNNLTEIDVSKNPALEALYFDENNLTEIDLSNNPALTGLSCYSNKLTALDVSNNPALTELFCDRNNLTELDVTNNPALEALYCYNNKLTALDLSNNPVLTYFDCNDNNLKFSGIKLNTLPMYSEFEPQADVSIASSIKSGSTIDLSSEYEANGKNTVYKWFDSSDNEVTPTKAENGVFTFGDEFVGKTLYCTMTNEAFPDFTLKTTSVKVEAKDAVDTPDNPDQGGTGDTPDTPDNPNQGGTGDTPDDTTDTSNSPSTGESIVMIVIACCLVMFSLVAISMVLCKKRLVVSAK